MIVSGTYDVNIKGEWPAAGGAIGSIRFDPEITHGANNGLANAIKLLEPVKAKYDDLSYADIFQMASARGIEKAGGPKIDMKYGRVDASGPEQCSPEGNLPDGNPGPDGKFGGAGGTASTEATTPNEHLRKVFYRMGLNVSPRRSSNDLLLFVTHLISPYVSFVDRMRKSLP